MRVECRVFPFLQRGALLQYPSSSEVILAAPLPLNRASLVAVDRRLEEVRRLSDVQLPRARVSRPPLMGSPSHSAASPPGITVVCTEHGGCPGHTRENVLCPSGRFRASNSNRPTFQGQTSDPTQGNWPPLTEARGSASKRLWGWVSRN